MCANSFQHASQGRTPPNGLVPKSEASSEYRDYAKFMAFFIAHYLDCKKKYDPLSVFVSSKIDPLPYQIHDFWKLIEEGRKNGCIRALVAYETGLGKTILVGMIIKELLGQPHVPGDLPAKRVLIVTPPSVLPQFRAEMRDKFGLEFSIFEPQNPAYSDLLIASMDTLKTSRWMGWLEDQEWDLVVVDEYHRISPTNLRGRLVGLLSKKAKHFIALTATPHDGVKERYEFRLDKIAPKPILIRRTKKEAFDISNRRLFDQELLEIKEEPPVTQEELDFYTEAEEYMKGRHRMRSRGGGLLAVLVGRAISSSLRAGVKMLKRRRDRILAGGLTELEEGREGDERLSDLEEMIERGDELSEADIESILSISASPEELEAELKELRPLIEKGEALIERMPIDSKGMHLISLMDRLNRDENKRRKAIVFTSFRETVEYLKEILKGYNPLEITGSVEMERRKAIVDEFTKGDHNRIIIGTEAMGESLNLQAASVEINYEVPWSPVTYIQRVGRIWRLKQPEKKLFVHNFLPPFAIEKRVMEVMLEKIQAINRDFGDIGLSVLGSELGAVDELVKEAYAASTAERCADTSMPQIHKAGMRTGLAEAEKRIEEAFRKAKEEGEKVLEVLSKSMTLPRVVKAEDLQKLGAVSLEEIVTEEDLKLFLKYLKHAGFGTGEFPYNYYVHLNGEYIRVDSFSLEGQGMLAAIEAGKRIFAPSQQETETGTKDYKILEVRRDSIPTEAGRGIGLFESKRSEEKQSATSVKPTIIRFAYSREMPARLVMKSIKVNNLCWFREPVLETEEGILTYRGVLSLTPTFAIGECGGSEQIVRFEPREEYEKRLKWKWLNIARSFWEDGMHRLEEEYRRSMGDRIRREAISSRIREWKEMEPKLATTEDEPLLGQVVSMFVAGVPTDLANYGDSEIEVGFVKTSAEEDWKARWEVEMMAVEVASDYYRKRGYSVQDVSKQNRGYDLECSSPSNGILRVEVKGLRGGTVPELTQNEKAMAAYHKDSYILFVVKDLGWRKKIYEVPNPEENLDFEEVLVPHYRVCGLEKFEVIY